MKVMYCATPWFADIEAIEVIKSTRNYVYLPDTRRLDRRSHNYDNYFDTWEEARNFLIDDTTGMIDRGKKCLRNNRYLLKKIKAMKIPEDTK